MPIKGYLCANRTLTRCAWGEWGHSFLPGDFQIDGKNRNSSKLQPVFLAGGLVSEWRGLRGSHSTAPSENKGQIFPEKPRPWPGVRPPLPALLRPPAHSQLVHGAGLAPSAALLCFEGNSGHTLEACASQVPKPEVQEAWDLLKGPGYSVSHAVEGGTPLTLKA